MQNRRTINASHLGFGAATVVCFSGSGYLSKSKQSAGGEGMSVRQQSKGRWAARLHAGLLSIVLVYWSTRPAEAVETAEELLRSCENILRASQPGTDKV